MSAFKFQTETKKEEKNIIEQFLVRMQYISVSMTPSECPDFEVKSNGKNIGVEVTKYFSDITRKGSKMQQNISEKGVNFISGQVIKNETAIQAIIAKKEISAINYKDCYDQKWLIIYAGGSGLHDIITNTSYNTYRQGKTMLVQLSDSPDNIQTSFRSTTPGYFTHIFVWDKFTEKIYQLIPYYKKLFDYGEKSLWVNHLPMRS